jgi:mRNA interferase RelE/StbE
LDLADQVADAVLDAITLLEGDPKAGRALRGRLRGLRALRLGSYRLVYDVVDRGKTVRVLAISHREVAYRRDPRR